MPFTATITENADKKTLLVSITQPDGQKITVTVNELPPIVTPPSTALKATPNVASFKFKEGEKPSPILISVTGPNGVIAYWSDQWDYCTVDDTPKKIPCTFTVTPNAKTLAAKAGFTSMFQATITAGTVKIPVTLNLSVDAGTTPPVTPPPATPPSGNFNGEPAIVKMLSGAGAPGQFWDGTKYFAAFASDGVASVAFSCGSQSGTVTSMTPHPKWINRKTGNPLLVYACPFVGTVSGMNTLKVTVKTNGGNSQTWNYSLYVGSANLYFQLVENQTFNGNPPTLPGATMRLFRNCKFNGGDRIFRYVGGATIDRPDFCESCTTTNVENGFRNCGGIVDCDSDGVNDDWASNCSLIAASSVKNQNAGNTGNHDDEDQFEGNTTNGVIIYGVDASVNVDGQGFSFDANSGHTDVSNVAMVDINFKTQSQHWSFYVAGSAKTGDGYVNTVRNLFMKNSSFVGGLFSFGAGGGTPARCTNVVIEGCSGDHIGDLAASGVSFR